jgi:hypothetical protein
MLRKLMLSRESAIVVIDKLGSSSQSLRGAQNYFQLLKKFPTRLALSPRNLLYTTSAMSMITATTWVPRGFAAPFPSRYQFNEDEYERISKLANLQLEDAKEDLEEAQAEEKSKSNGTSTKASKKDDECVHSTSYYLIN